MTSNLFLVPVGKSPVHSYRLLNAIEQKDESLVILVVSELTEDSGNRIKEISHDIFTGIQVVNYTELKEKLSQLSSETKPNIISGPATREINLVIWHDVISTFSKLPNIWVDHARRTKQGLGKPTDEHYLYNLSNRNEKYALNSVSMKTAIEIYDVDISDFSEMGALSWNEKESRFYYKIFYPQLSDLTNKDEALIWETTVKQSVKELRELVGNHVLNTSHYALPSMPKWWMNIKSRLNDSNIFGGSH